MARTVRKSLEQALVHNPTMALHNLHSTFGSDFDDLTSMNAVLSAARDRRAGTDDIDIDHIDIDDPKVALCSLRKRRVASFRMHLLCLLHRRLLSMASR